VSVASTLPVGGCPESLAALVVGRGEEGTTLSSLSSNFC